jgi:plastocyanin
MSSEQPRSRKPWKTALAALALGLGAGVVITASFFRAAQPVAFVAPGADVQVTNAGGQSVALPRGGGLRHGQHVQAGARTARITLARGGAIDLAPHARLALTGPADARLETGMAIVDTTTVVRQVRIVTPAGQIVLTAARVELRASLVLPPAQPGGEPAMAFLHVDEGLVQLESGGRSLLLEAGQGGLLVTGRPPMRRPATDPAATMPLAPAPTSPAPADDEWLPPPAPVAVVVPVPVGVALEGTISGVVEMDGAPPAEGTRTPACASGASPAWSVAGGRLAGVYVRVSSALPATSPRPPVEVFQHGCAVVPRVTAVLVGQRIALGRSDDAAHQVRVTQGTELLSEARLAFGAAAGGWTPSREGIYLVRCDAHPDASGVVAVSAHPLFAVTGSDGSFVIARVPPGRHTVTAWHERGGEKSVEVTVTAGQASEARFKYAGEPVLAVASPQATVPPVTATSPAAAQVTATVPMVGPARDPEPPARPGIEECQIAVIPGSPVAQACVQGGVERATAVMTQIVSAARGRGLRVRCQSCHTDPGSYALRPRARDQLARLLAPPEGVTSYVVVRPRLRPARAR